MKTIPTIRMPDTDAREITRAAAASHLRRERREGKIFTMPSLPGYVLTKQGALVTVPRAPRPRRIDNPHPMDLFVRLSHKYVDGWSYLDKSHNLGEGMVTHAKPKRWDASGDYCRQLLIVSPDETAARYRPINIIRAIRDSFTSACRCEHDCCGHVHSSPSRVRPMPGNRYAVLIDGCRNV